MDVVVLYVSFTCATRCVCQDVGPAEGAKPEGKSSDGDAAEPPAAKGDDEVSRLVAYMYMYMYVSVCMCRTRMLILLSCALRAEQERRKSRRERAGESGGAGTPHSRVLGSNRRADPAPGHVGVSERASREPDRMVSGVPDQEQPPRTKWRSQVKQFAFN